tara:strand:- start:41406 stop:42377 length:972 start_codon:yes stop_codon:yes gene_type:complete
MSFQTFEKTKLYQPNDKSDFRLSQQWHFTPPEEPIDSKFYSLCGYPSDEGINNNGGRIGAQQAPDKIRYFLSRMTPPALLDDHDRYLWDLGNVDASLKLEDQQSIISRKCYDTLELGGKWIGIGGGHDYGFPDGDGFLRHIKDNSTDKNNEKPLVINFDAHLDVRPDKDKISSGTPFYKLLNTHTDDFDFVEIGIQSQCNSKDHVHFVKDHGGEIVWLDEILHSASHGSTYLNSRLTPYVRTPRPTFISVDIDAFSNAFAMGCSQSWGTGLTPEIFFPHFKFLTERLEVMALGVYEVSPPLDRDDITSKLASQIIYNYIYNEL